MAETDVPPLDSGAEPGPPAAVPVDNVPERIGPYKILDVLGEGGMGMVYLAEQAAPVRRRVALKIIKLGMDTKQVIARFESERQALAVMDHPNIAKVFDGGATEAGRPYFVMELVQGTPITAYADTHKLDIETRLRLFIDVCAAVQHAHQKGVIHRDLKPSNVLVTVREAKPVVKIIDFGIAKAMGHGLTERTLVTHIGQMIGTAEYMSPEQAEMSGLDVDTRTDIYSLGVVLYELLAGVLPFDLESKPAGTVPYALRERDTPPPGARLAALPAPALETIARQRSTSPGLLPRHLRGDLDWIVLMAMDKDRTRRYDTAHALALDLERHLGHRPVQARPPSAGYRVGKFVRRNRNVVIAGTVAVLAILAGAAATTVGMIRARDAQARAEREAETARRVSDFLVSLFQVSDPSQARGNTITAREILDRGAAKISSGLDTDPAVQARLAGTIGDVYSALGLLDAAQPQLERAVSLAEGARAPHELARSLERLGTLYRMQGKYDAALPLLRRALALQRRSVPADTELLALTLKQLAGVYVSAGRYPEAEPAYREALRLQTALFGDSSAQVASTLGAIGGMYWSQRRLDTAEVYLRRGLAMSEKALPANDIELAAQWTNLGAFFYVRDRYDDARGAYERALAIYDAVAPDNPFRLSVLNNLAEVEEKKGNFAVAEREFRHLLAAKEKKLSPDDPSIATTLTGLANTLRDQHRFAEAEPLYRRAVRIIETKRGLRDPSLADTLQDYARMLRAAGRRTEAAALEQRAAAISGSS